MSAVVEDPLDRSEKKSNAFTSSIVFYSTNFLFYFFLCRWFHKKASLTFVNAQLRFDLMLSFT